MKAIKRLLCMLTLLFAAFAFGQVEPEAVQPEQPVQPVPQQAPQPATVPVVINTTLGDIVVAVEVERAPLTAANFLRYVDQKRLDGVFFYRAMKLDEAGSYGLIQGGVRGDPKRVFKPVAHEPTTQTGLSHVSGAISLARLEPGTATADFFIVMGDLVALDAQPSSQPAQGDNLGYAVFARVVAGMDVVKTIMEQPRSLTAGEGSMKGQMLEPQIRINSVRRAMPEAAAGATPVAP